jgi:hypothetical protein
MKRLFPQSDESLVGVKFYPNPNPNVNALSVRVPALDLFQG